MPTQLSREVQTDPKSYIKSKIAEFHEKKSFTSIKVEFLLRSRQIMKLICKDL